MVVVEVQEDGAPEERVGATGEMWQKRRKRRDATEAIVRENRVYSSIYVNTTNEQLPGTTKRLKGKLTGYTKFTLRPTSRRNPTWTANK